MARKSHFNINPDTLDGLLAVCDRWPDVCRPMTGLHPEDLANDLRSQLACLKEGLDTDRRPDGAHRFIGIGETGLDLYWDKSRLDDQIESFKVQIGWALEYDLPIVIHSRDSFTQLYDVEQEKNGICRYNREPKVDPEKVRAILSQKAAVEED